MTGLDLGTFLRLLRADLWDWVSLSVVIALLGILAWATWGSRRALRKCLVASLFVHLGLIAFGGQTGWVLRAFGPAGVAARSNVERIREIRVQPRLEGTDGAEGGIDGVSTRSGRRPMAAWDRPGQNLPSATEPMTSHPRPPAELTAVRTRPPGEKESLPLEVASPRLSVPDLDPPENRGPPEPIAPVDAPSAPAVGVSLNDLVDLPQVTPGPRMATEPVPDLTSALRAPTRPTPRRPDPADLVSRPRSAISPLPPAIEIARGNPSGILSSTSGLRPPLPPRPLPDVPEVYRPRLDPDRSIRAQTAGASPASEDAVERALVWLAAHQDADGRWDAATARDAAGNPVANEDDFTIHCPPGDVCFGECHYWEADTALTGLALLAYLGAGYTHMDNKVHAGTVAKGLQFLVGIQKPDGDLRGRSKSIGMYCHAMAALALCEAYALTGDERLRRPAERAVDFLVRARARDGMAWRYAPGEPIGDTSILGWVILVLKSAQELGFDVPASARDGSARWLKLVSSGQSGGLAMYQPGKPPTPTMTAEAWVCRQFLGTGGAGAASDEAAAYLLEHGPARGPLNLYYWYYGTLALFQRGGPDWNRWNEQVREELTRRQKTSGHQAGSWDPSECKDRFDALGGRIYCTAVATLTLEVYYRYLRLYEQTPAGPPLAPSDGTVRRVELPPGRPGRTPTGSSISPAP